MEQVVNILNCVFSLKPEASSFKLYRATSRLVACGLQLVAVNSRIASSQLTSRRN